GIGLARAGYAKQNLVLVAGIYAAGQFFDGIGLVAFRPVIAGESEIHFAPSTTTKLVNYRSLGLYGSACVVIRLPPLPIGRNISSGKFSDTNFGRCKSF